jgi:diguanylate cyclase (GGDEF)-like protein/PAS domain S-box-containing protein
LAHSLAYAIARQRLDEELRHSAEDHQVLFENNPFSLLVYDANTLRFLAVNNAAMQQYGYTRAEFLSRSLPDVWPAEEAERALASVKAISGANVRGEEWRHQRKDGSVFDVEVNAHPINFRGRRARIVLSRDITVRKRAIQALEMSELRFRKLFQYSLGLICTHDLDGVILSVNPATARVLDYSITELMGRNLVELMPPKALPAFRQYLERIVENGEDSGLLHLISRDGQPRIWEYHNVLDDDSDGVPYVLGHAQDITDRRRYEQQLREQSIRDPLTGCYNRRYLDEHVASLGAAATWGCVVIDLDHFKQVNDTCGHQRGDEVLIGIGRFLSAQADKGSVVVRMGGDEFMVLLRDGDEAATERLAARLRAAAPNEAPIAFTVGWATREPGETLDATIRRADNALYATRVAERS